MNNPSCNFSGKSDRALWIGVWVVLLMLTPRLLIAQDSANADTKLADWKDDVIWRVGEYGKTSRYAGIYRLTFSDDGELLAARNQVMEVSIIDVATHKVISEFEGHDQTIQTIDFSPDGTLLVTAAGANEKVKIWDVRTGKLQASIDTVASAAYFNRTGGRILVLGERELEIYSYPGLQRIRSIRWKSSNEAALGMSQDGRLIMLHRRSNNVGQTMVMDTETRSRVTLPGPGVSPRGIAFSPDRNWLALSYARDSSVRLWDLRAPHARAYSLEGHDATVQTICFSADSRYLLSGGWDDRNILWEIASRKIIRVAEGHSENVNATAFSPHGFRYATGASGRTDNSMLCWKFNSQIVFPVDSAEDSVDDVWRELASANYRDAMTAVNRIAANPKQWLPQLETRIKGVTRMETSGTVDGLVKLLDSPSFKTRENALMQLIKLRIQSDSQIRAALENTTSPEVKYRLRKVLQMKISRPEHDDKLERQWVRLILALELVDSAESRALLNRIATGHENVDFARAAQGAINRLASQLSD